MGHTRLVARDAEVKFQQAVTDDHPLGLDGHGDEEDIHRHIGENHTEGQQDAEHGTRRAHRGDNLLAYNLIPSLAGNSVFLIGASASVLAVIVATAVYAPDYKIGLLFLGEVAIKWVAIVTVAIYLIGMETGNIGGNIAHIGGALVGAWFALRIKRGRDITRPLNAVLDAVVGIFNGRSFSWSAARRGNKAKHQQATTQQRQQPSRFDTVSEEELDRVLKKIKDAGYDALTDAERDMLFKASRRRNP